MLAHRYASWDNSRGLVKNYERGIKTKPSERPGVEQRLVLSVERNASQAAITRHRAAERTRGRTGRVPPVLCPSLHSLHSASKQSYLSIYHPFRFSASYLNSSMQEPTAVVTWPEPKLVKVKRKRLLQGQRKVSSHQVQDLKIWRGVMWGEEGWGGSLSQHLSPALSRLNEKDPDSHCHYIIAASLVITAKIYTVYTHIKCNISPPCTFFFLLYLFVFHHYSTSRCFILFYFIFKLYKVANIAVL